MESVSRLIPSSIQGGEDHLASISDTVSVAAAASQYDAISGVSEKDGGDLAFISH